MPQESRPLMAEMAAVASARGVRIKETLVETGHARPHRSRAAASPPA